MNKNLSEKFECYTSLNIIASMLHEEEEELKRLN
jgi:hypothetical protein